MLQITLKEIGTLKYSFANYHPPTNLVEATDRVVMYKGIRTRYVIDQAGPDVMSQIGIAVDALLKELDARNMQSLIIRNLAWSDAEALEWFAHPDRQIFESGIEIPEFFWDRMTFFLDIGHWLRMWREVSKSLPSDTVFQQTTRRFRNLVDWTTANLFINLIWELSDLVYGFNPEDRAKGKIQPNDHILSLYRQVAESIAPQYHLNPKTTYNRMLRATGGGDYSSSMQFLHQYKGDRATRAGLQHLVEIRTQDPSLNVHKLSLIWITTAYRMAMGVDFELLLQLNGFKPWNETDIALDQYITDTFPEFRSHVLTEAASATIGLNAGDAVDLWRMLEARAECWQQPNKLLSPKEMNARVEEVWSHFRQHIPWAFQESPLQNLLVPIRIGSQQRAYNITFPNSRGNLVQVTTVGGRDDKAEIARITAHELGHSLHSLAIELARQAGEVTGGWEDIPMPTKELFSQLLESQGSQIFMQQSDAPLPPTYTGGLYPHLLKCYVQRRQASYARAQQFCINVCEILWLEGHRDLVAVIEPRSIQPIQYLIQQYYIESGLKVPTAGILADTSPTAPLDGLVYLKAELQPTPKSFGPTKPTDSPLIEAFKTKFANIWLSNRRARLVLYGNMIASMTTPADDLPALVGTTNPQEIETNLIAWGANPSLL